MSVIIQLSSSGASTFGTAIICIYHIISFVRLQHTPSPYCRTRTRRRPAARAQRRYFGAASTANAERKLRRYKMPRRPKVPNFLTWPSACSFSQKAAACRCSGTLRRRHASPRGCTTSAASFRHRRSAGPSSTPTRARYRELRGCYTRRSRRSSGSGE